VIRDGNSGAFLVLKGDRCNQRISFPRDKIDLNPFGEAGNLYYKTTASTLLKVSLKGYVTVLQTMKSRALGKGELI
jgi:hypothetical protein